MGLVFLAISGADFKSELWRNGWR